MKIFIRKFSKKFDDFKEEVANLNKEGKEVFNLINKYTKGQLLDENGVKRRLSVMEQVILVNYSKKIFKFLGMTSLFMLPGGSIVILVIHLFKKNKDKLPDKF